MASLDDFPRYPADVRAVARSIRCRGSAPPSAAEVEIWAKREDCNSGIAFGGNKVRKLEYLVADALAQGCDTLVSDRRRPVEPHRARSPASPAHLGLKAVTVQEHWVDWHDRGLRRVVGNIQLTRIMGGDVRIDPAGFDIGIRDSWRAGAGVGRGGRAASPTPSRPAPPTTRSADSGFADWAREVAAQEAALGLFFDHVIVCTVTGSTHAGMIAGFALEDRRRPPGHRHRRLGDAREDRRPGDPHRRDTAARIGVDAGPARTTRSRSSTGYAGRPTASPTTRRSTRSTWRPHRRDAHRPRLRRQVDGWPDRHDPLGRDPAGLAGALRPPGRPDLPVGLRRRALTVARDGPRTLRLVDLEDLRLSIYDGFHREGRAPGETELTGAAGHRSCRAACGEGGAGPPAPPRARRGWRRRDGSIPSRPCRSASP